MIAKWIPIQVKNHELLQQDPECEKEHEVSNHLLHRTLDKGVENNMLRMALNWTIRCKWRKVLATAWHSYLHDHLYMEH